MSDRIYKHSLSVGLVIILTKVGEAIYLKGENKVHMQRDLSLSNTEFANYQKLRLFGLIAHYRENGEIQRGWWLITDRGTLFLRNKMPVHSWVQTKDNELVARSPEMKFIKDIWQDYHAEKWQQFFPWESREVEMPKQLVMSL